MKKTFKILIVDDDPSFRGGICRLFHAVREDMPVEVFEAGEGQDAMKLLEGNPVDCILLDYQMPGGSGLHWLNKMLASDPDAAVIMVTGGGDENVAVQAMKDGVMDYLMKGSLSPANLQRAVLNAIEKRGMARKIRKQQEELIEAERQRVMIESLGAACHHLGQPATVINTYLSMMKRMETKTEMQTMIHECQKASDSLAEILSKLQHVASYRTEPYYSSGDSGQSRSDERILKI